MNTSKLKRFAQQTRLKLLEQVEAKLEYVLTADTGALREKAPMLQKLKSDLNVKGRDAFIDRVAYTWFNRFVALRYMDVRGFQPLEVSVLTPAQGQVRPQLLREALSGNIPAELPVDRTKVMNLLDGKISSDNAENDAYRILLIGVCNHLHSIFPFLYERIDDYSELLLPDDLTSEFSIIHDVIDGMTEEDCQQVEVLGWLYQFYISEKKDEVFASKAKVSKEEIPAATQLFTPRWIVEYMVQNTVGKLWVLNNPNSRLKEHMPYYIESEVTAEDVLKVSRPEELTLLDQACGSGHILVYGFELLYKIYEEQGYAPSEIPKLIIEHNLHGFEIDERAAQLAGMAVLMKAREHQKRLFRKADVPVPNITCFEDLTLSDEEIKSTLTQAGITPTEELLLDLQNMQQATNFGSLIVPKTADNGLESAIVACKAEVGGTDFFEQEKLNKLIIALETLQKLSSKVCCVVDNPPYMGGGNMNKELADFVKVNYPYSKADLMTCFMEAGWSSIENKGFLAMINLPSWLFLSSFEKLRSNLNSNYQIDSLLHMGRGIFGIDWGSTAFAILKEKPSYSGSYFRLHERNFQHIYPDDIASIFLKAKNNPNVKVNFERYREGELLATIDELIDDDGLKISHNANQKDFEKIPGSPIGYWVSENIISAFKEGDRIEIFFEKITKGAYTGNNLRFLRFWYESQFASQKWRKYNKAGGRRKWYGLAIHLISTSQNLIDFKGAGVGPFKYFGKPHFSWGGLTSGAPSFRVEDKEVGFDDVNPSLIDEEIDNTFLAFLNSKIVNEMLKLLNPTMHYQIGDVRSLPIRWNGSLNNCKVLVELCIYISKSDWNSRETSWDFQQSELIRLINEGGIDTLEESYDLFKQYWTNKFYQLHQNEEELNRQFIEIYGLQEELTPDVPLDEITILQDELDSKQLKKLDKVYRKAKGQGEQPALPFKDQEVIAQFVSYAVGCMFGRYSLDKEGLILANQGETVADFYEKIGMDRNEVRFHPDQTNILPVLDTDWFEDDIVSAFNRFIRASFGDANFQKNLAFIEDKLGKDIRSYFNKDFYKDHIQRYKKRPIYWKFSSPKGYFSVLIYMHRYTPDTLNNILNDYLREFIEKLKSRMQFLDHVEATGSGREVTLATKEKDQLRKMLRDCEQYERDILYSLASERIAIDLDDGVLVNYNKFGAAIEPVVGLNDPKTKKKVKEFDWIDSSKIR